jgi:hypothetical protein
LLGSPAEGPTVDIPPPTSVLAVFYFLQEAPESWLISLYCPDTAHWNKRKQPQYGHTILVVIYSAKTKYAELKLNMLNMQNMHENMQHMHPPTLHIDIPLFYMTVIRNMMCELSSYIQVNPVGNCSFYTILSF